MNSINIWPILITSVVGFGISSLWYSPILFGKEWADLLSISDKDIANMRASSIWTKYIVQFILSFISFSILAFVMSIIDVSNTSDGAFVGLIAWLGFMLPLFASGFLWKKDPFKLMMIDAVNYLLILTIGGAILGTWR